MNQWEKMNDYQADLIDFVKVVKTGLQYGLASISLSLVDLELYHRPQAMVLDSDMEAWSLRCIVENPLTRQIKETRTTFQGDIGDTDVDSVKDMVASIVESLRMEFYGKK